MNDLYETIKTFLQDYGILSLLILTLAKFLTGVIVAVDKNEFKWFYLGNIFKTDLLKLATITVVLGLGKYAGIEAFSKDYVQGTMGAVLAADLMAGILKNLAHLFPAFADAVPSSFREPARLRLGNPKNIPTT